MEYKTLRYLLTPKTKYKAICNKYVLSLRVLSGINHNI